MPKANGAPDVGDLVTSLYPGQTEVWLVVETRSVHLRVISEGERIIWVRRASVRVVNESR